MGLLVPFDGELNVALDAVWSYSPAETGPFRRRDAHALTPGGAVAGQGTSEVGILPDASLGSDRLAGCFHMRFLFAGFCLLGKRILKYGLKSGASQMGIARNRTGRTTSIHDTRQLGNNHSFCMMNRDDAIYRAKRVFAKGSGYT
jgi:hypothetical protein